MRRLRGSEYLWIFFTFFAITNAQSNLTSTISSNSCSSSQLLCGESTCYEPTTQICSSNNTIIQCIRVCVNQCYDPSTYYCSNKTICPYPSRVCNGQCLPDNQMCVNNVTTCNIANSGYYYGYYPSTVQSCNGTCYDSASQMCSNSTIQCLNNCSGTCYNSSSQQCLNGTLCSLNEKVCYVKYNSWGGENNPPSSQCYNPSYQVCLNGSVCFSPSQLCNGRCLLINEMCVNNVTTCNIANTGYYYGYQQSAIQSCNGTCYDSASQICSNGTIQCVNNCSGTCFNSSSQQCFNGTLCSLNDKLCYVKYNSWGGENNPPLSQCFNPSYQVCLNGSVCSYPYGLCSGQCLAINQMCVNNVTTCNIMNNGSSYRYQQSAVQSCNGTCYDSASQICSNGTIQCVNNCSGTCFNSSSQQCFNGTLCSLNDKLCYVKYANVGTASNPLVPQCYNPSYQVCLNGSVCLYPYRLCNGQCLPDNQMCVNNVTTCNIANNGYYYAYYPSTIQSCNGTCYDSASQICSTSTIECIGNCSGKCYNPSMQKCFSGLLCGVKEQLCQTKNHNNSVVGNSGGNDGCYDPLYKVCLNNGLCDRFSRSCNEQCLGDNQVCVRNTTICNVTRSYVYYQLNQIQLCDNVCYDTAIGQCIHGQVTVSISSTHSSETMATETTAPFVSGLSVLTWVRSIWFKMFVILFCVVIIICLLAFGVWRVYTSWWSQTEESTSSNHNEMELRNIGHLNLIDDYLRIQSH